MFVSIFLLTLLSIVRGENYISLSRTALVSKFQKKFNLIKDRYISIVWQTLKKVAGSSNFRARLTSYGLVATAWSLAIISAKPIILSARYRVIEQKILSNILFEMLYVFFLILNLKGNNGTGVCGVNWNSGNFPDRSNTTSLWSAARG